MSEVLPLPSEMRPSIDHLVTEDDTPVDNIYSEKQQRLLTESLYSSWPGPGEDRPFVALANVGLYYSVKKPPVVPDVLLSLDVQEAADLFEKKNRCYLMWEFGKPPDVITEVVSNREGEELGDKKVIYSGIGVSYYVVWDPINQLKQGRLLAFALHVKTFVRMEKLWFPDIGLGLTVWHGVYANTEADWLRWCDQHGNLIPFGGEQRERAENAEERADKAEERAERLAKQLRDLGVQPTNGEAPPAS